MSAEIRHVQTMSQDIDTTMMASCLELAKKAQGRTSPNPMVGAVVLNAEGRVVGQGYHHAPGQAHAEIIALDIAGNKAKGGTLYVNLEPCCHHGKTAPCVERVIASGVKRVVAGMEDPNPEVNGGGIKALRAAGIEVVSGVMEQECRWLNRGFIKYQTVGLPWLCLKLASTLDGKIADRDGTSRWISGPEARDYVHSIRNVVDCVMVGGATAVKDDPQLNVRDIENARDPMRAVVDSDLFVSPEAKICQQETGGPTMLFCSRKSLQRRGQRYPRHVKLFGLETKSVMSDEFDLAEVLSLLAAEGVRTVLCEGGSRLSAALLKRGLVDEVHWIISPKIIGDPQAIPAIADMGRIKLGECWGFRKVNVDQLGLDILVHGEVVKIGG